MVSDLSGAIVQPLEDHVTDRTVRDVLIEFGNRLANTYSGSHLIALYRIALTEATRHSGIGREFCERGPGKLTKCLAQYLEYSAQRFNQLRIVNPERAAGNFISLLIDDLEISDAMTARGTSSAKDLNDAVVEAVELFCHGIVTRGQWCKPLKQHTPATQIDVETISDGTTGLMRIKDHRSPAS